MPVPGVPVELERRDGDVAEIEAVGLQPCTEPVRSGRHGIETGIAEGDRDADRILATQDGFPEGVVRGGQVEDDIDVDADIHSSLQECRTDIAALPPDDVGDLQAGFGHQRDTEIADRTRQVMAGGAFRGPGFERRSGNRQSKHRRRTTQPAQSSE